MRDNIFLEENFGGKRKESPRLARFLYEMDSIIQIIVMIRRLDVIDWSIMHEYQILLNFALVESFNLAGKCMDYFVVFCVEFVQILARGETFWHCFCCCERAISDAILAFYLSCNISRRLRAREEPEVLTARCMHALQAR